MDIPRKPLKRLRFLRGRFCAVVGLLMVGGPSILPARLDPLAPVVERETLLLKAMQQCDMVLEVCGASRLSVRTEFGSVRLR